MSTRSRSCTPLFLLVVLVSACSSAMHSDTRAAEQAIREVDRRWMQAIAARDVTTIMSFYADDAMLIPSNGPAARGKDAIRDAWTAILHLPDLSLVLDPAEISVDDTGDSAYETGVYRMSTQGPQGRVDDEGSYVTVWRREKGEWKVRADISHSNRPVLPLEEGA